MSTSEYIALHRTEDVRRLALNAAPADVDMHFALQQIEGWQAARNKLPTWANTEDVIFPPRLAMEQCSSETTARLKAKIVRDVIDKGEETAAMTMADLTGGYGVDFLTLAPLFDSATYVERQGELVEMVRHNSTVLPDCRKQHVSMHFYIATAEDFLETMIPVDVLFLDPARRDSAGHKVALIEDCQPDVCALNDMLLSRCHHCLIKLSPMLDITAAIRRLRGVTQVHVVSLQGECKEVLLLLTATPIAEEPLITCHYTNNSSAPMTSGLASFSFHPSEEREVLTTMANVLRNYLYEPDAALLKAGCFRLIGQRYGVEKLAADTHLYVSDKLIPDFPGRVWHIKAHSSFAKRELRSMLNGINSAEIATRNFPTNVATLRRQLRLPDGGNTHLIATTLSDGTHRLLRVEKMKS